MTGTPLYRDSLALCAVLLHELAAGESYAALRRHLEQGALRLVDQVALAFAGMDRRERVEGADAELQALRAHLHLALELGMVDEECFLALAEQADAIGRQLGGWLKKLRRQAEGPGP